MRLAFDAETGSFAGPVEVDGTHIGGKRKNKPLAKRKGLTGRGTVDTATVAGIVAGMAGKRPRYSELAADDGRSNGARR